MVVVNGAKSQWALFFCLMCAAGHCSRSTVVSLYINDIMVGIESEIRLFADDSVCYRQIDITKDISNSKRILINWANGPGNEI